MTPPSGTRPMDNEKGIGAIRSIRDAMLRSQKSGHKQAHLNYGPLSVCLDQIEAALTTVEPGEVVPPANCERDPEWAAIRRTIDHFVGRKPVIGKHHAVNTAHVTTVVAHLDAIGEREAADTIVWLCWHRALDRERERFLSENPLLPEVRP